MVASRDGGTTLLSGRLSCDQNTSGQKPQAEKDSRKSLITHNRSSLDSKRHDTNHAITIAKQVHFRITLPFMGRRESFKKSKRSLPRANGKGGVTQSAATGIL